MEKQGAERDEVARYELARHISSNEAIWRILQFPIHDRYPAVLKLNVHQPDGQRVYFTSDNVLARAETPPETTLTGFFKLCKSDDFAKGLLYCDVPRYYTCVVSHKKFKRRVQGTSVDDHPGVRKSDVLGRVYTVHPNQFQCFCLRMLLHEVRGPTCFEDLRTVDGVVYDTFQEAANKRGLLEDDAHWNDTLEEAAFVQSSARLRTLFAVMLRSCEIADPKTLWTNHRDNMSADILMEARRANPDVDMTYSDVIYNQALVLLEDKVLELDGSDLTTYGLNAPMRNNENMLSRELIRQTNYDLSKLERLVRDNEPKLTHDQENVYSSMLAKIENTEGGIVFLDAPGGTGKTFLINLILAKIRLRRQIGLAVAFSGIAGGLLDGGRTAHSTFNVTREESPTRRKSNVQYLVLEINMSLYCQILHSITCIGFIHSDCCIVCCHLPDTRKPCIENRSVQTGSAYYLITAFSVRLLSQLGGNKDHSTKLSESCLTCMLVVVRSECEFVIKFPLKYSRGH